MTEHAFEHAPADTLGAPKLSVGGNSWSVERCRRCGAWRGRFSEGQSWMGPRMKTCEEHTAHEVMDS